MLHHLTDKIKDMQAKRLMADIREWYRTHPMLPTKKREILVKLHDEYNKEIQAKEKEKAQELKPTSDALQASGNNYNNLVKQGQSLGSIHDRELKGINEQYLWQEFEYFKPFIKKIPKANLRPGRAIELLKKFYQEHPQFITEHRAKLDAIHKDCEIEYATVQTRQEKDLEPLLEKQAVMQKEFEDLKAVAKKIADKFTKESDAITYRYMKIEWQVMNDRYAGGNGVDK